MQTKKGSSMDSVEPQTGLLPAGQVSHGFFSDPLLHPSSPQQERDPLRLGFSQSVPAQHLPSRGRENCCADSRTVVQMVKNLPEMWETWVQSLGWEGLLEECMVTYSSILAWKIPWTEEPGGLQSALLST